MCERGGKLILFGNGGSATDANDWAIDCVLPPGGWRPIPAISLSLEPANITAMANDVGTEVIFLRQLIAHARPEDVAIGISTSGGSRNIIMALEEARKRGCSPWRCWAMTAAKSCAAAWPTSPYRVAPTTFRAFRKCRPPSITCIREDTGGRVADA